MSNNIEAPRGPKELFVKKDQPGSTESMTVPEGEPMVLPLGELSNFVLNEQPRLLAEERAGQLNADNIARRQRELLMGLDPEDLGRTISNPDMARFAMLDLSFAMSALTFSKVDPPIEIRLLNAHLSRATGIPELMTFEKIVSINSKLPFDQMRTFSDSELRTTERHFYYGHDLMDSLLQNTTDVASQSLDILLSQGEQGVREAIGLLSRGASNTQRLAEFMRNYHKMPGEHFKTFRQYISSYPDGKTRNASGAFIGMPRLQIRLTGLTPKYEEFLDESMRYFPVHEQPDIKKARAVAQQGHYLIAECEKLQIGESQLSFATALKSVIEPIRDFRLSHYYAVYRYVPEAMPEGIKDLKVHLAQTEEEPIFDESSTVVKGTAGFIPGPLLRNVLRMDIEALKRLDTIINRYDQGGTDG